ncbi:hypothetical protein C8J57DRAFT_1392599 [Mycena rebaudengoi]|nr:hypothetical protein C8J57DRAFT_1392599 [Mycena rebaudengoi]
MSPSEKFLVTGGLTLVALAVPDVQQGRNTPFSSSSQPCPTSLRALSDTEFEGSPGGRAWGSRGKSREITGAGNTGQRNTRNESSVKRPKSCEHREFFPRTIMP